MEVNNTRDFTETKKEELFDCLDEIAKESKRQTFTKFCGLRARAFGDWDETLDIAQYTAVIDEYNNAIVDLNESLKTQIETNFTIINDVDSVYQQKLVEYYETIDLQCSKLQTITEAFSTTDGDSMKRCIQQIKGEDILIKKLEAQGITDAKEQQKIVDATRKMHPDMLNNLYVTSLYSSATSDDVYEQIMIEYKKYEKMSNEMEQHLIDEYSATPAESQQIVNDILRDNPEDMKKICSAYGKDSSVKEEALSNAITNYAKQDPIIGEYYVGKYKYPVEYMEGILFDYEKHAQAYNKDGVLVYILDNNGRTIGYGHDVVDGETFPNGLTEEEAVQLAISDLDKKYDDVTRCIDEINEMTGMNISIDDFTENEKMFLVDFAYNRGRGLYERTDLKEQGVPHSSLALLIIAVDENDYTGIKEILATEICNKDGERMTGLVLRREDEYEILTQGNYERLQN